MALAMDVQADAGHAQLAARRLRAHVDEQHPGAGRRVAVDVQRVGLAAVQEAGEPGVLVGDLAAEAVLGEVLAGLLRDPEHRRRVLGLLQRLGVQLPVGLAGIGQALLFPRLDIGVARDRPRHGQRLADAALDVGGDLAHRRRQVLAHDAIAHRVADQPDAQATRDQDEGQQAHGHTQHELLLDGQVAQGA
jgi:hypothetical protein